MRLLCFLSLASAMLVGCAGYDRSAAPASLSSADELRQDQRNKLRWHYRAAEADLSSYSSFMIEPVAVLTGGEAKFGSMSMGDRQRLAGVVGEEFIAVIGEKYPLVREPGPGVGCIRLTLLGIERTVGGLATVSRIIPRSILMNAVESSLGKTHNTFTGSVELAIETFDSASGTLLTADIRRERPAFFDFEATFSTTGTVRSSARDLALALRDAIDKARQKPRDNVARAP